MLTGYEVLKEPVDRNSEDVGVSLSVQNAMNGDIAKSETPSVKKRHRRMKSSSNKANDLEGKLIVFKLQNRSIFVVFGLLAIFWNLF